MLCILVENEDGPGPFGAKGVGEGAHAGAIAAIACAIADEACRSTSSLRRPSVCGAGCRSPVRRPTDGPASVDLHRAASVEEATDLLLRYDDDAMIHCGGTELLLAMKLGFARYGHLVDIKPIGELSGITTDGDLRIGATSTHRQIADHPEISDRWHGLAEMAASIGNQRVRNVSIGGNLCFAEPHSDPAISLMAADASIECRRGGAPVRSILAEDFVEGPFQTALEPGELLTSVRVPPLPRRRVAVPPQDYLPRARVAAIAMSRIRDNRIDHLRLAVGAAGIRPAHVTEALALAGGAQRMRCPPARSRPGVRCARRSAPGHRQLRICRLQGPPAARARPQNADRSR